MHAQRFYIYCVYISIMLKTFAHLNLFDLYLSKLLNDVKFHSSSVKEFVTLEIQFLSPQY